MSNFIAPAIHPATGQKHQCEWLDNYFGHHRYGVRFPDGTVFPAEELTPVEDQEAADA